MSNDNLALFADDEVALSPAVRSAMESLAQGSRDERGAIYTKKEVVNFILDLVGYSNDKPLHTFRILEPSFGEGDFLVPIIERLLQSFNKQLKRSKQALEQLTGAIRAVELHKETHLATRAKVSLLLESFNFSESERDALLDSWLICDDFLLAALPDKFDVVVGNPPYVRQELIPDALLKEYRRRYATIYDRADIYIPFIERSLRLLREGGSLGFICADRWMKNRYGGPLRRLIADKFRLKFFVDMVDTPAFHSDVIAYPAITVISREPKGTTRVAYRPTIDGQVLSTLAMQMRGDVVAAPPVHEMHPFMAGDAPWIFDSSDQLSVVRRLESSFPTLEDAGCKVGIGVATGADKIFIAPFNELDVEESRKLPLVMTRDILDGSVRWRGLGVINPFTQSGDLVRLSDFPKLADYLEQHGELIRRRHVSKKNPEGWYRTIDRITPSLAATPKLLIPDIKGEAHIVYEDGKLYPHHNLYFITSTEWDLRALQAILMSGIARVFVGTYSTRMRGGYLRFQAQYLRRIRIPHWSAVSNQQRDVLIKAAQLGDIAACNRATCEVFSLSESERLALGMNTDGSNDGNRPSGL